MKYLITGAGGQLGKQWIEILDALKADYDAFDRNGLDITDMKSVQNVFDSSEPDICINCAAYTKVDKAEEERGKAEQINASAVSNLAKECAIKGVKLVHYSTDYVFGGKAEDAIRFPNGYPEDTEVDPVNFYGLSKRKGEEDILDSGADHLIIRVSWLCGVYGNNFVKTMIRLGSEKDTLSVVNDQIGCPAFTRPVVENTLNLLNESKSGIYHLRSAGKITWYDLAQQIFEYQNIDIELKPVNSDAFPSAAKRPAFSLLDISKAESVPGMVINDWKKDLKNLMDELDK